MLAVNISSGRVITSGTPTKKVPVNSSSDSRNTKIALAMMPGAASGKATAKKVQPGEAPMLRAADSGARAAAQVAVKKAQPGEPAVLRAANSRSRSTAAKAAEVIHTE